MPERSGLSPNLLVLGGRSLREDGLGWHLGQLSDAAQRRGVNVTFGDYESLSSNVSNSRVLLRRADANVPANSVELNDFDAILTRTMPAGSFEQITFRLSVLHDEYHRRMTGEFQNTMVNPPSGLELAIDKYATLARAAKLGISTPPTEVVQSRSAAMDAFDRLGRDVVVKPIFGGEGRGVMRVQERELAWTVFSTLEQMDAALYVQQFMPPGGVDLRLLVIGDEIHAIRRTSQSDFRTNIKAGGRSESVPVDPQWRSTAMKLCQAMHLRFAAVDLLETDNANGYALIEVNAIPGWKSAQSTLSVNVAEQIISQILQSIPSP